MSDGNDAFAALDDDDDGGELFSLNPYRHARRAKGLCLNCTAPAAPGRVMCAYHLAYNIANRRKVRARKAAKR